MSGAIGAASSTLSQLLHRGSAAGNTEALAVARYVWEEWCCGSGAGWCSREVCKWAPSLLLQLLLPKGLESPPHCLLDNLQTLRVQFLHEKQDGIQDIVLLGQDRHCFITSTLMPAWERTLDFQRAALSRNCTTTTGRGLQQPPAATGTDQPSPRGKHGQRLHVTRLTGMQNKPVCPVQHRLPACLWLLATLPTGFCKERHIQEQPRPLSAPACEGQRQEPSHLRNKKSW